MSKQYEADSFIKTGGTDSQYLMANGTTSTGPSGGVDVGTGTANKVAKFSDSDTITDSIITDNGTGVGIGTDSPNYKLHVLDNSVTSGTGTSLELQSELITNGGSLNLDFRVSSSNTANRYVARISGVREGDGALSQLQFWTESSGLNQRMTILSGGNVGIGTTDPQAKLEVVGALNVTDNTALVSAEQSSLTFTSNYAGLYVANTNQTDGNYARINFGDGDDAASSAIGSKITSHSSNYSNLEFWTRGSNGFSSKMLIEENGNVGIGTDSPSEKLEVDGNAKADSFIKDGGTSSQFLKADGSVDSSAYSTTDTQLTTEEVQDIVGAMVQSNVENLISVTYSDNDGKLNFDASAAEVTDFVSAANGGTFSGAITIDSDTDTILKLNNSDNGAQYVTYSRSNDRHAYIGFGGSSDNFTIMSEETGGQILLGTAATTRMTIEADGDIVIGEDLTAGSFIKSGGTSAQFLKADGSVDSNTYAVGTIPTDFVSAAGGGTFDGDITADAVIIAGGSSTRFLKADGSLDGNTYVTGAGSSGNIAYYSGTNAITDTSALAWDAINDTLDIDGDLDVTGNILTDTIQADGWTYVPQTFQANFVHTGGNSYMNLPFNSLSDASSGGEQHFIVTPYGGYVHSVAFKNTATGNTMTATNMNFRVLKNGIVAYTSNSQTFSAAQRTYKGWVLSSTNAIFNAGDDLRFQFRCTSGLWQDTCAVVVLKCII